MIIHTPREQWLMRRRELITASDAAAVLGLDQFRKPSDVYLQKVGLAEATETEPMRWGKRLESAIAMGYSDATQRIVHDEPEYEIATHPDFPWLGATLDRGVSGTVVSGAICPQPAPGKGALELKATSHADQWDIEPPLPYQIQLTIQMACTAREWGSLAAFVSLYKPVVWCDRVFDPALFALLVPRLDQFRELVRRRDPPTDLAEWFSGEAIRRMWPADDGGMVALDDAALDHVGEWELAKWMAAVAKAEAARIEDILRLRMGASTNGLLPDGTSLTLKTTAATEIKGYTRESFRVLRRFVPKGGKR